MNYDLSIIVCCYNGVDTLTQCLNSLFNQKLNDGLLLEIILIDDGSKDGSKELIKSFISTNKKNNIHFKLHSKKNEGLSKSRNTGISLSNSKIISFIDEDAIASENWAQKIISFFKKNNKINCLGGKVNLLNKHNSVANLINDTFIDFYFKNKNIVIGTNMSFRKDFLKTVGGFQNEFTYRGDESALIMKSSKQIKIYNDKNVVVSHNQPISWKHWLNIRYENGFFGIAIDFLIKDFFSAFKKLIFSFIFISLPFLIFLLYLFGLNLLANILLLFFLFIFLKKFIINKYLSQLIMLLKAKRKYVLGDYLVVILMAILGEFKKHLGNVKGFFAYRKQIWTENNIIK